MLERCSNPHDVAIGHVAMGGFLRLDAGDRVVRDTSPAGQFSLTNSEKRAGLFNGHHVVYGRHHEPCLEGCQAEKCGIHDMTPRKHAKHNLCYTLRVLSFMRDRLRSVEVSKQQLAASVRRIRDQRGLKQDELADRVGLSRSAMGAIERAEVDTAFSTAKAIADELGVSISVLAGERSEEDSLSEDALKIARAFDHLDLEDRATMKRVFLRYAGTPPATQ